jgi:hypothetical protein
VLFGPAIDTNRGGAPLIVGARRSGPLRIDESRGRLTGRIPSRSRAKETRLRLYRKVSRDAEWGDRHRRASMCASIGSWADTAHG